MMFWSNKRRNWITLISVLLAAFSVIACAWIGEKRGKEMAYYFVTDSNTLLAVVTGISSFLFFRNLKVRQSRIINTIAASTFGVLLIHAHSDAMRRWLWGDALKNTQQYHSPYLALLAIGSVLGVFIVCVIIDQCRIHMIERPVFKFFDRCTRHFEDRLSVYLRVDNKS